MDMNVYISESGKTYVWKGPDMTPEQYEKWKNKVEAFELFFSSPKLPDEYKDPNYDPDYKLLREAAYRERRRMS
jgi:hypothetical protein